MAALVTAVEELRAGNHGRVERMQATWRDDFHAVPDPPRQIDQLNPLIDAFAHRYNTDRPHDALGQRAPSQYLDPASAGEPPPSHMC